MKTIEYKHLQIETAKNGVRVTVGGGGPARLGDRGEEYVFTDFSELCSFLKEEMLEVEEDTRIEFGPPKKDPLLLAIEEQAVKHAKDKRLQEAWHDFNATFRKDATRTAFNKAVMKHYHKE